MTHALESNRPYLWGGARGHRVTHALESNRPYLWGGARGHRVTHALESSRPYLCGRSQSRIVRIYGVVLPRDTCPRVEPSVFMGWC